MDRTEYPITIVGCGPGSSAYLTARARSAIRKADVLVGARRLLDLFPRHHAEKIAVGTNVGKLLASMDKMRKDRRVAVLVTGDPGLCSLAAPVIRHFGRKNCEIVPGISSVQFAFARLGLDWTGVRIIDAHGTDPDIAPETMEAEDRIAILAGRKAAIRWAAGFAEKLGSGRRIIVCEDLSLKTERIREVTSADMQTLTASPQTVILIIKEATFNP